MDLTLWTAVKNCLKGEWIKVSEVTPFLLETFAGDKASSGQTSQALNSQVTSIAWSPQADFGLTPTPPVDGSLLIAGNRAGSLVFLRYRPNETIQHVLTFPVLETWITHIACSSWIPWMLSKASLNQTKQALLLYPGLKSHIKDVSLYTVSLEDWICGATNLPTLAGRDLVRSDSKLKSSQQDIIVLTLFDGSFHVVYNVSGEPTMTPPTEDTLVTSEKLSRTVRSVFARSEQDVDYGDMNRITGLTSYDGSSTFIWIQEAFRPADFSYKHDAKHNSTLLVSSVWNDSDDEALVGGLKAVLDEARTGSSSSPFPPLSRPHAPHSSRTGTPSPPASIFLSPSR
ncbi:hypothetical protein C0991_007644 [Blastosporella zonata]|nr:hypothetical protein C0991_007644 [Blastosporella zonata]